MTRPATALFIADVASAGSRLRPYVSIRRMSSPVPAANAPPVRCVARRGHFDNRELATIAMLATLHFAASFVAKLAASVFYALLGPYYIFPDGIGGEILPCLLLAAAVTLVPRVGTAALSIAVVALLNGIVGGSFAVVSLVLVLVSVTIHELVLGTAGVTLESPLAKPTAHLTTSLAMRTAMAIGVANALTLYAQYFISMRFYKLHFDMWFVHAAALITGLLYGAIGAAIGTAWGFQLRRTAP